MTDSWTIESRQHSGPGFWSPLVAWILPLLSNQLSEWAVFKNHVRLPVVTGDLDLCVPRSHWDAFVDAYLSALSVTGSYAVVICDHYVGVRFTFAAPLDGPVDHALEIDLADGVKWKGTSLLSAEDTLVNCVWDARGFRRVATGVEAAYQLTCNAVRHGGGIELAAVEEKAIRAKALADPTTFHGAMSSLHGPPGGLAAQRFLADDWRFWVGLLLTSRRMLRALRHPTLRSAAFVERKAQGHWHGLPRRIEGSTILWLRRVSRSHRVHVVRPAVGGSTLTLMPSD